MKYFQFQKQLASCFDMLDLNRLGLHWLSPDSQSSQTKRGATTEDTGISAARQFCQSHGQGQFRTNGSILCLSFSLVVISDSWNVNMNILYGSYMYVVEMESWPKMYLSNFIRMEKPLEPRYPLKFSKPFPRWKTTQLLKGRSISS